MDRNLIESDLDEFTEAGSWPEPDEHGEPTPVADATAVAGVVSRLKRLTEERAQIVDVAQAQIDRIVAWRDDRSAGIDRDIAWGERSIENFMRTYAASSHKKSLPLPDGTPKLSAGREKVEVVDDAAFLSWALGIDVETPTITPDLVPAHPEVLRVTYAPNKTALIGLARGKKMTEDGIEIHLLSLPDGEMVPGVEIRRNATDSFSVKISEA